MQEAGTKFRHLITFDSGEPTSDLTYTVKNQAGATVVTDTVAIASGQLSLLVEISELDNAITEPFFEQRTLEWEYTTATQAVSDSIAYTLHTPINFPVSKDSVRDMLGVSHEELEDRDIDMFGGYMAFREYVGSDQDLSAYENTGDFDSYRITKAIEAAVALQILPSIQVRLPKKYDSGTSAYERWNTIDWEGLRASIDTHLARALELIDPTADVYEALDIFVLSDRPPDPITGE